jgi:hypothetical protein
MTFAKPGGKGRVEQITLDSAATHIIEECRMVLPGIQALFGFQLIAVFNQGFMALGPVEKNGHLCALLLVTLGIALIMTPAIFHRIAERGRITRHFIDVASYLIAWAMAPLALGITVDVTLVTWLITRSDALTLGVGITAMAVFTALWFVYPWARRARRSAS